MPNGAIFHMDVQTIKRAEGRSAVAAAAYRAGTRLVDIRTGTSVNYTRKRGVLETFIAAPNGCDWITDRETLWNAAEAAEHRKNSVVAREWMVALPSALDAAQRTSLARALAVELVTRYGVAVDVALHAPAKDGDERNFHAHLLTTTREVTPDGLGDKTRILDAAKTGGPEIAAMRKWWQDTINDALEAAEKDVRVDHRPRAAIAKERGEPAPEVNTHDGPALTAFKRRQRDAAEAEQAPETPEATPEAQRAPKSAPPAPDSALLARGDQNRTREAQSASKGDERTFEGKCLDEGLEAVLRASPGPRDAKTDFERAAILLTDGPDRLEDKWHDRAAAYRPNHQWPGNGPLIHEGQRAAWALSKLFQGAFTWADVPDGSRSAVRGMLERLTEWGRPLLDRAETLSQIATERMAKWRVMQVERVEWSEGLPAVHGHDHTTKAPLTARLANEAETAAHFVNARKFPDPAARERIAADMASVSRSLALRDVKPGATLRMVGLKEVRGDMIVRDFQPVDPKILPAPRSEPQPDRPSPQAQPRPDQSNGFKPR